MDFVDPPVAKYAEAHTSPLRDPLQEVAEATQEHPMAAMLSGHVVGRLLSILVATTGARRVLEVGTFTGYSALAMAGRLPPNGELVTFEHDPENAETARKHFESDPNGDKVRLVEGDAHKALPDLQGPFDLAFLDADKTGYGDHYEQLVRLVRPGGLIVIDNTLWSGRVLDPDEDDEDTKAIARLNDMIVEDPRVSAVLLTVRDGLTIALREDTPRA